MRSWFSFFQSDLLSYESFGMPVISCVQHQEIQVFAQQAAPIPSR